MHPGAVKHRSACTAVQCAKKHLTNRRAGTMLPSLMTFGAKMRKLRETRGLTRRDVEDISGVSQRQQAYLENDTKDPKRATLEALSKALGPEIVQAAFPKLSILADSRKSPTARETSFPEWPMLPEPSVLASAGVGG